MLGNFLNDKLAALSVKLFLRGPVILPFFNNALAIGPIWDVFKVPLAIAVAISSPLLNPACAATSSKNLIPCKYLAFLACLRDAINASSAVPNKDVKNVLTGCSVNKEPLETKVLLLIKFSLNVAFVLYNISNFVLLSSSRIMFFIFIIFCFFITVQTLLHRPQPFSQILIRL